MKAMTGMGLAVALAALLGVSPALAASPEGIWEIEMKDSRYRVELCGDDGAALCGTLIWLGNGADSPENLPYLNTLLIDHARPTGPGQWQGDLHIYGQSAAGTIAQVSDDQITLTGCAFGIICKTYQLYRYVE
tara:strand:+ start:3533 stop:3931 length:399 start_codon:yes stop_codon:yes gene_type:complete